MVNSNWSLSLIAYCIRYFYLTNGASGILTGDDGFILIDTNTISLFKVSTVVIVWAFRSVAALMVAQARFTLALVAVEVLSWLLFATCRTSSCFHRYAPCG
jgi:small-conductance mechanosensitive channel